MKYILVFLSVTILVSASSVSALSLQVRLNLDNTQNTVYIPGSGEVASASLTDQTYSSPPHHYLASYLNGILYSLVSSSETPISIATDAESANHSLIVSQNMSHSNVFLVFSRGGWREVESRISSVEGRGFLHETAPSFGFGTGLKSTIQLLLSYSSFNIQNDRIFQQGKHRLVLNYVNYTNNRPDIEIDAII